MAVQTITINSTDITNYLLQPIETGFEYRNGESGITANGSHYQNIIAKKEVLTLKFKPLNATDYATIRNLFYNTDEYTIVYDNVSKNYYRGSTFKGINVGDHFVKDLTIDLKEI